MTSIFENTHSSVTVHILHDDTLTENNRQKFIRTAEKYHQYVDLVDVTRYRDKIDKKTADFFKESFTVGALYRLAIPEVLELDKVIYLDCDVIVNLDICELWEACNFTDWGVGTKKYLAAVMDVVYVNLKRSDLRYSFCKLNGCNPKTYINTGVLVMNLKAFREYKNFFQISTKWLRQHLHSSPCADQDALNSLLYGSITFLDKRFNRFIYTMTDDLSCSIIHAVARHKPWLHVPKTSSDMLYWKMYLCSAWGENATNEDILDMLASVRRKEVSLGCVHSFKQCAKRLIILIINKFIINPTNYLKIPVTYIYYSIKYKLRG